MPVTAGERAQLPPAWGALRALEDDAARRARTSGWTWSGLAAGELTGAAVVWQAAPASRGAALGLGVGGLGHAALAAATVESAVRRSTAADQRSAAWQPTVPGAWEAALGGARRDAERDARAHAAGVGLHLGVVLAQALWWGRSCVDAGAVIGAAWPAPVASCPPVDGAGLAVSGLLGAAHEGWRWRAAVQQGSTLDRLDAQVPGWDVSLQGEPQDLR